jgi:hypothetical protein
MGRIMKFLAAGALAATMTAGAAQAATVGITGSPDATGGVNEFAGQLATALPGLVLLSGASFSLAGPAVLTFTAIGAESSYNNAFNVTGLGTLSESGDYGFPVGNLLTTAGSGSLSGTFGPGLLDGLMSFTSNIGLTSTPGMGTFGVFVSGGAGNHSVFFLAYDDNGAGPDDNHDDFLIRVNVAAVPLPAAGFLLIGALGGLAVLRRRKTA